MPKNINSASRLLIVLQKANTQHDNIQTLEAWATTCGVTEETGNRKGHVVADRIRCLHRELEITLEQLKLANISKELYEGRLSNVDHALSTMLFAAPWSQVKQYLTPEVLVTLAFSSEILPDEESQISSEDLAEIKVRVEELREAMDDATVSPRLQKLIRHHIELIELALAEYPITGAKAFREAGQAAIGEIIEAKDQISADKGSPAVGKLDALWKKVNESADVALKAEKLAQLGQKAWDLLGTLL